MPRNRSSNEIVNGSNRSELIITGRGKDTINAGGGNDWIFSGFGKDVVNAGDGNDLVFGGAGSDEINGGAGRDRLFGGSGNDHIDGGSGNDLIFGGSGADNIQGGSGDDRLFGGSGNDVIDGGAGRDVIYAGSGNDILIYTLADQGNATNSRPDYYNGGSGFDTLRVNLTAADLADPALVAELSAYLDALDAGSAPRCAWLPSLNLVVTRIEALEIYVDGVLTDPRDMGGVDLLAENDAFDVGQDGTVAGDVAANDTAPAGATFTLLSPVVNGTLVLGDDGMFSYDPDGAFDSLAQGETATETFTYQLSANGQTVTATATITVTGSNDAPAVEAALTASVTEGDTASVNLLQGARDLDNGAVLSVANVAGLEAGLSLDGATLEVDTSAPEIEALAQGETRQITISYDVQDEFGASVAQSLTITLTGTNDAPIVAAALEADATEDGALLTLDLLDGASDVDNGAALNIANLSALPDGVSVVGSTLAFDPSDAAYQSLGAGDELTLTVAYDIQDGAGGSVPQTAEITITGTNDAPTVSATITASVEKNDPTVDVDLLEFAADVDQGTVLSIANVTGLQAGLSLSGTTLSVDPSDAAFAGLAPGDALTLTVNFDVVDGDGGAVAQTATITIIGSNDAPVVQGPILAGVIEDASGVDIDMLAGARDPDGTAPLQVQNVSPLPEGVSVSGTTLTVAPSSDIYQALAVGEVLDFEITYDIVDEFNAFVSQTISLTIIGRNDAPTVQAALSATVNEDDTPSTINLLDGAADIDLRGALSVQNVSALPPGVELSGTVLVVVPSDAAFQSLSVGETATATVTFDIVDDQGAAVAQTVTIQVVGTNDAPIVAAAISANATEDAAALTLDLLDGASDVDGGTALDVANVSALPDGVSLSGTTLTVNPGDAAFQALAEGVTQDITVTYDVVDGDGGAVAQTATITITGTNDAPTVTAAIAATAAEDDATFTLDLLANADDVDTGDVLSVANVTGLGNGLVLSGTDLIVDPSHPSLQALSVGDALTLTVQYDVIDGNGGVTPTQAQVTINGTNDAPVVELRINPSVLEDSAIVTIDLLAPASDVDASDTLSIASVTGLSNGAIISGNNLVVDPSHPSLQSLAFGEVLNISIDYLVVDGNGGETPARASVQIRGTNDAPVVQAALTVDVTEDDAAMTLDLLDGASDVDNGAVLSVTNVSPLPDGLSLVGATLTVDPSDPTFQSLALGEVRDIVVNYDVIDGQGGSVPQSATITITGTNDAPTVASGIVFNQDEDAPVTAIDLLFGASDVDNGAVLSVANVTGLAPGMVLNGNTLEVDPSDAVFQSLNVGQSATTLVSYDIVDENGASVPQTVEVTISGTNDAPTVAAALSAETNEDDPVITLDLLDGAADIDNGAVLGIANVTGLADGFSVNGTSLEVDPSVAFYQPLAVGESLTFTVNYDVVDENGASVAQSATVVINGTNDAPVATAAVDTQFALSGVDYALTLDPDLFFDIDTSDTLTLSAALENGDPLPSWLSFDAATGTFSGTPSGLAATLYRVEVTATDPHGASASVEFWLGEGAALLAGTSAGNEVVVGDNAAGEILFGGQGTDLLSGRNPSDIYVVTADNDLTVIEDNGLFDSDVLLLDGIDPADVVLDRRHPGSTDLVISVNGVALVLVLNTLSDNASDGIEQVAFGDGTILSMADVRATILAQDSTTGADIVSGFGTREVIDGGAGNDFLEAGDNSDEYVFATGDGQDVVDDNGFFDVDIVRFTDRASTDATFSRVAGDADGVLISFANGDSVELRNGIGADANDGIEQIIFDGDSVTLTSEDVRATLVAQDQTAGDDSITGFAGDDTIEGGTGNDFADGGEGSDTYIFSQGDGADIIRDTGFGDLDRVLINDYELGDAVFSRVPSAPNDIIISLGNGDQLTLVDSFAAAPSNSIERVVFQGSATSETLTIADIRAIVFENEATAGNDVINAGSNNLSDTIEGGAGDDFMSGGDGSDTYVFGSGDGRDVIFDAGFLDTDILDLTDFSSTDVDVRFEFGDASNVILSFTTGEELTIIDQTSNSDRIERFVFGDMTLDDAGILALAAAGVHPGDVFTGDNGANTLSGDGGYDILSGGNGNDTYIYDAGDQRVDIDDNGNGSSVGDSLEINGYSSTDATFTVVPGRPGDLRIVFGGTDEITVRNGLANSFADNIETFTFNGDGVTLTLAEVRAIMVDVQISAGDDTVTGYDIDDTIEGGTGDDVLSGGRGSDTYVFNVGDGADIIDDNGTGNLDVVQINGYNIADATLSRVPGTVADLLIDFGSGDSITILSTLTATFADSIEQITFDGPGGVETLNMLEVRNLLTDQQATTGDDVIIGTGASETLEGGLGDDFLSGQGGGDTYVYSLGDGNDVILENGGGADDILELNGITSGSVTVTRAIDNPNTAILTMADGGTVRLDNSLPGAFTNTVDLITFVDDGVMWDMGTLRETILASEATAGDDDIVGWITNDTLSGGAGDDFLSGGQGSDTFVFEVGDGDDIVFDLGGGGTDVVEFVGRDIADADFSALFEGSNDLLIEFTNGDSVVVRETIPGGFTNRIEEYAFDDGTLTHADILTLL